MMHTNQKFGNEGEHKAKVFLEKKGYRILDLNWRYKKAEIDIVAFFEDKLIIVEVKTRSSHDFGLPQDFVNKKKIKNLLQAANAYIGTFNRSEEVRFDIVSVFFNDSKWEIEHLEDAFYFF